MNEMLAYDQNKIESSLAFSYALDYIYNRTCNWLLKSKYDAINQLDMLLQIQ